MVEPITCSIISLVILGVVALNSTGLTLSYLIPWCCRKVKENYYDYSKPIYIDKASTYLALVLREVIKENQKKSRSGRIPEGQKIPLEIHHSKGTSLCDFPNKGCTFSYGTIFHVETIFNVHDSIVGIRILWDQQNSPAVTKFLDGIRARVEGTEKEMSTQS